MMQHTRRASWIVVAVFLFIVYFLSAPLVFILVFYADVAVVTEVSLWVYSPVCLAYLNSGLFSVFYDNCVLSYSGLSAAEWYFVASVSAGRIAK